MKRNIIFKGLAALTIAGSLASCSSSYLDIPPVTNIDDEQAFGSAAGLNVVMAGVFEAMNKQYVSLDWNGNCGEAFVGNMACDALGPDLVSGLWGNYPTMLNFSLLSNEYAYVTAIPWQYYWGIIGQCNRVIANVKVDDPDDPEFVSIYEDNEIGQVEFYLAQAYTMRAHAYQKLMGLYAPRWEDSREGEAYCIPVRVTPTTESTPLRKVNYVFNLIYSDLDRALELYAKCGTNRANKWECDANVAHGIYARAALMKHDWTAAQSHAAEARKGYTVMDAETYLGGFTDDCSDYIWHMNPGYDTTYYWSWGSHNACNGGYCTAWGFGAGAINIDLYNEAAAANPTDIRLKCYLTPDKVKTLSRPQNRGGIKEADFWNPNLVDQTAMLNLAYAKPYSQVEKHSGMYNVAAWYSYKYMTEIFTGQQDRFQADDNYFDYIKITPTAPKGNSVNIKKGVYAALENIPFGAQYKFWGDVPYGNLAFPWMRASEMCLVEAEAYYEMGNEANAKKCLEELMKMRVEGYTCKTTGTALRDEIRLARRMELFMEGQNFTDFKRWNLPFERRAWKANDPTSGNTVEKNACKIETTTAKGWRFAISARETQYNDSIDTKLLDQ